MMNLHKFTQLGITDNILNALIRKGFEEPTPIQEKIIPKIIGDEGDLVGQAQTGTGKTAAFGIPIIEKISERSSHVQVLILTPTRELAIQVSEELNSLKGEKRLRIDPIYGGQSIELQLKRLKKGVDIVVGTPGRVLDLINRKKLDLGMVSYVVLDEADEMLNMGFIEDVELILSETNKDRTTLLFSATMPREVVDIAKKHMKRYEVIQIAKQDMDEELTDQIYFEVSNSDKLEALCRIIDIEEEFYGLVFCRTKVDVSNLVNNLIDRGYDADAIHGDLSQSQREKVLKKFRSKQINILIATDVAARGIDIEYLTHVINFAIPQDADSYVHRIGRTGRAGREGTAITFITPEEYRKLMYIKKATKSDIKKHQLPNVNEILDAKKTRIITELHNSLNNEISDSYRELATQMLNGSDPIDVIATLLKNTYKNELDPSSYNEVRDVYPRISGKTRLFIARGKKDGIDNRKLVDFIKNKAGIDGREIEGVQVMDKYSFITVPFREAELILKSFKSDNEKKRPMVEMANDKKDKAGHKKTGRFKR